MQHHAIVAGQNIPRAVGNREQWEWEGLRHIYCSPIFSYQIILKKGE